MAGASAAKARRKANAADERLFDRELEDLPAEMRWREWMLRVEAVIFASAEPVSRETLARVVGKDCSIDLLIDDLREELSSRPTSWYRSQVAGSTGPDRGSPRRSALRRRRRGEGRRRSPSSRRWC